MFAVDDVAAEAIRRAYEDGGELAGVIELRKHFPLVGNNPDVRSFVRTIASWTYTTSHSASDARASQEAVVSLSSIRGRIGHDNKAT